jgi:hypothetical protein
MESPHELRAGVLATDDGRFAFQIFRVSGEPKALLNDSARYPSSVEAAQAGYKVIASMRRWPPGCVTLNNLRTAALCRCKEAGDVERPCISLPLARAQPRDR